MTSPDWAFGSRRSEPGPQIEAGALEMAVKAKDRVHAFTPHESEGKAIGDTQFLIGEFLQPTERLLPLLTAGVEPDDFVGSEVIPGPLGGIDSSGLPREQSGSFVQDMLAREERGGDVLEGVPPAPAGAMKLIARQDTRDQRARIHEESVHNRSGSAVQIIVVTRGQICRCVAGRHGQMVQ